MRVIQKLPPPPIATLKTFSNPPMHIPPSGLIMQEMWQLQLENVCKGRWKRGRGDRLVLPGQCLRGLRPGQMFVAG